MQTKLLINGSLVPGEGQSQNVLDPATGKPIAQVAEASGAQVEAAVAAAEGAFDACGRGRLDRALELSLDDGGVEARSCARRRQHSDSQARGADAPPGAEPAGISS